MYLYISSFKYTFNRYRECVFMCIFELYMYSGYVRAECRSIFSPLLLWELFVLYFILITKEKYNSIYKTFSHYKENCTQMKWLIIRISINWIKPPYLLHVLHTHIYITHSTPLSQHRAFIFQPRLYTPMTACTIQDTFLFCFRNTKN